MAKSVAVVDYGAGNILNVLRAFGAQGVRAQLVSDPSGLEEHSHIVLPGVGSFRYGMEQLVSSGLAPAIRRLVGEGKPLLGICLGMQLLAEAGVENGTTPGLDLIGGTVANLRDSVGTQAATRVPHTGWATVRARPGSDESIGHLGLPLDAYFNHSFFLSDALAEQVVAVVEFGSTQIPAAVSWGSVMAVQFHPEKSGQPGLRFLSTWYNAEPATSGQTV